MRRSIALLAAALAAVLVPSSAGATAPEAQAWWYIARSSQIPIATPVPPSVDENGLYVAAGPNGAIAVAALRAPMGDADQVVVTLTLTDSSGDVVIGACRTAPWFPVQAGNWDERPEPDCEAGSVLGSSPTTCHHDHVRRHRSRRGGRRSTSPSCPAPTPTALPRTSPPPSLRPTTPPSGAVVARRHPHPPRAPTDTPAPTADRSTAAGIRSAALCGALPARRRDRHRSRTGTGHRDPAAGARGRSARGSTPAPDPPHRRPTPPRTSAGSSGVALIAALRGRRAGPARTPRSGCSTTAGHRLDSFRSRLASTADLGHRPLRQGSASALHHHSPDRPNVDISVG